MSVSRLTLRIMQLRVYEAFLVTTCQYTQKWCALLKYNWEINKWFWRQLSERWIALSMDKSLSTG